jgi:hypothetical protein
VKTPPVYLGVLLLALLVGALTAGQAAPATKPPAERRMALIGQADKGAAAVPALTAGLQDENLVVRRTAVRLLIELGAPGRPALTSALTNDDALVRRAALAAVCDPLTAEALPHLKQGLGDSDALMRLTAVQLLVQLKPRTQEMNDLLEKARNDEFQAVREVAAAAVWPFFKETISIRDRKDWDHEVKVAQQIPLPLEGWRFKTDPKADGHLNKWYEPAFNDSAWLPIKIGQPWEEQGQAYDGVAWYRGAFDLPAKPQCLAVEMAFEGVDEIAWVWINGQYVGQHDLGTEGWNKPFALDVTKELKWGEKNQITVRVYDSAYAGGIWKPVTIQVLQ